MQFIRIAAVVLFGLMSCPTLGASCRAKDLPVEQSWNPPTGTEPASLQEFYGLDDKMSAALHADNLKGAELLAHEYLKLAERYPCNWNYGNAIHDANTMLGHVAMNRGDQIAAVTYLERASKSPGSPQLDSFGPSLELANELVSAGKVDAVIAYLVEVKRFWRMDDGEIDKWVQQLKSGEKPDFSMQLE